MAFYSQKRDFFYFGEKIKIFKIYLFFEFFEDFVLFAKYIVRVNVLTSFHFDFITLVGVWAETVDFFS